VNAAGRRRCGEVAANIVIDSGHRGRSLVKDDYLHNPYDASLLR
jgi:hypothetical protein